MTWRLMQFDGIAILRRGTDDKTFELRIYRRPVMRFDSFFQWVSAHIPGLSWVWPAKYEYEAIKLTEADVLALNRGAVRVLMPNVKKIEANRLS